MSNLHKYKSEILSFESNWMIKWDYLSHKNKTNKKEYKTEDDNFVNTKTHQFFSHLTKYVTQSENKKNENKIKWNEIKKKSFLGNKKRHKHLNDLRYLAFRILKFYLFFYIILCFSASLITISINISKKNHYHLNWYMYLYYYYYYTIDSDTYQTLPRTRR